MAIVNLCGEQRKSHKLHGSAKSHGLASSLHPSSLARKPNPHNISNNRMPMDHTSALNTSKSSLIKAMTSGAMNCTVPTCSQGVPIPEALPKLMRTTVGGFERRTTCCWLMLRWAMPCEWQWWRAPTTCWNIPCATMGPMTSPSCSFWHCSKFCGPASSKRSRTRPSVRTASRRRTLGWRSRRSARASLRRLATLSGSPRPVLVVSATFMANFVVVARSRTRNTLLLAPRLSHFSGRKCRKCSTHGNCSEPSLAPSPRSRACRAATCGRCARGGC
mmetsp:Transcript_6691/g.18333  ORF Transcript_6691/g.18333 Transcript_6691/m.18333 type:complete len:275 (+) Transcript_6691:175-999(+)